MHYNYFTMTKEILAPKLLTGKIKKLERSQSRVHAPSPGLMSLSFLLTGLSFIREVFLLEVFTDLWDRALRSSFSSDKNNIKKHL